MFRLSNVFCLIIFTLLCNATVPKVLCPLTNATTTWRLFWQLVMWVLLAVLRKGEAYSKRYRKFVRKNCLRRCQPSKRSSKSLQKRKNSENKKPSRCVGAFFSVSKASMPKIYRNTFYQWTCFSVICRVNRVFFNNLTFIWHSDVFFCFISALCVTMTNIFAFLQKTRM